MASCAICKKSILFGGESLSGVRYCSKRCAEKGRSLALTPDTVEERTKPKPAGPVWVFLWAVIALLTGIINVGADLASWPKGAIPQNAFAGSLGYGLGSFLLAGICMLWKQHRSWHSFFKVASIIGILLMFSTLGRISKPPAASAATLSSRSQSGSE